MATEDGMTPERMEETTERVLSVLEAMRRTVNPQDSPEQWAHSVSESLTGAGLPPVDTATVVSLAKGHPDTFDFFPGYFWPAGGDVLVGEAFGLLMDSSMIVKIIVEEFPWFGFTTCKRCENSALMPPVVREGTGTVTDVDGKCVNCFCMSSSEAGKLVECAVWNSDDPADDDGLWHYMLPSAERFKAVMDESRHFALVPGETDKYYLASRP